MNNGNDVMCHEVVRFLTFLGFVPQEDVRIAPIQLAADGFYVDRRNGRVHCFSCSCEYNREFTVASLDSAHDPNCRRVELNRPVQSSTVGSSLALLTRHFNQPTDLPPNRPGEQKSLSQDVNREENRLSGNDVEQSPVNGAVADIANNIPTNNEALHHVANIPTNNPNATASILQSPERKHGYSRDNTELSEPAALNHSLMSCPQFSTKEARLMTFGSLDSGHRDRHELLSEAGFFHTGHTDIVKCFSCGLELKLRDSDEGIYYQHAQLRPDCAVSGHHRERGNVGRVYHDMDTPSQGVTNHINDTPSHGVTNHINDTPSRGGTNHINDTPSHGVTNHVNDTPSHGVTNHINDTPSHGVTNHVNDTPSHGVTNHVNDTPSHGVTNHINDTPSHATDQVASECTRQEPVNESSNSVQPSVRTHNRQANAAQHRSEELRVLGIENELLTERTRCRVCCSRTVSCIFLPCGHLAACQDCSDKASHCVICGRVIIGTANVFLS